ncbi:MAG: penicillin-binding protein 2 [Actinomycetota bacterium]
MSGSVSPPRADGRRRFDVMALVAAALFAVLVVRLTQVQLVAAPDHRDVAAGNRVRVIESPAPRGRLLDAGGRVLAGNRSVFQVTLDWERLVDLDPGRRRGVLLDAADELAAAGATVTADDLAGIYERARRQVLEPVIVADDITPELWIALAERSLPGIDVVAVPRRTYPNGRAAAHVIGYLGSVVDDIEAARRNRRDPGHRYRAGDPVGRTGLEKLFEAQLRGVPEVRRVEVDSANRVVRTIEVVQPARAGHDVHLTIDLDLQLLAAHSLAAELDRLRDDVPARAASMVVVDPTTGAVPALVSFPDFDPTVFVAGLGSDEADALFADPNDPFLNRAIDGLYPAGSTFKPITAYAALETGLRQAGTVWDDRGSYRLVGCDGGAGCRFRNAGGVRMGPVDLRAALARSSDTYFYSLGERLWLERTRVGDEALQDTARRFGLGSPTGIELPGEAAGRVPTPEARRAAHDAAPTAFPDPRWYTGDSVNLAIGQGELLATPLQLANLYAAVVSDGARHQPRLVDRVVDGVTGEPVVVFAPRVDAGPTLATDLLDPIVDGLLDVPVRGTAAAAFAGFPHDRFALAAKTGTAEVDDHTDYALFAGAGPLPDPTIAFAVVIEEGGFGGDAAAPVARRFLDGVLNPELVAPDPPAPGVWP